MDILSVVTRVPILVFGVERNDDDFADRINYKYTVAVLVIFAIIVTNRQFGTKQIHCWIPAYFTRNYEEYINDICWVSNTYYISLDQKLPEAENTRKSFELKYYQWVPFILLSQAFFFYIPHIAWRALSRRSGIDIRDIVEAASNYKSVDKYENRQKYMSYMLTAVDQYVDDPRRRKESRMRFNLRHIISGLCFMSGKFLGNYLMVLYLFIKLAFIANCICQLFVLNLLLGHEFHKFGFELLDKILNGKGWDTGSRIFPKISMCDFRIREVGNPKISHRYTVQCVLPINLFNQQIFTFIWFWYTIVLLVNTYSLFVWTYRFLPSKRLRYISRRIEIMRQALFYRKSPLEFGGLEVQVRDFEKDIIKQFVDEYLESDGLFILRVLSSNTSDFVCTELIQELWKYYRKHRKFNRSNSDDEDQNLSEEYFSNDDNEMNANENNKPRKLINQNITNLQSNNSNNNEMEKNKEIYNQNIQKEYGDDDINKNNEFFDEKPINKIKELRRLSSSHLSTGLNTNDSEKTTKAKKLFKLSKQKITAINRMSNSSNKLPLVSNQMPLTTSRTRMLRSLYKGSSSSKTSYDNNSKIKEHDDKESRSCSPSISNQDHSQEENEIIAEEIIIAEENMTKNKSKKSRASSNSTTTKNHQYSSTSNSPGSPQNASSTLFTQEEEINTSNPNYVVKTTRTASKQLILNKDNQDENKNINKSNSHKRSSSSSKLNATNNNSDCDSHNKSNNTNNNI